MATKTTKTTRTTETRRSVWEGLDAATRRRWASMDRQDAAEQARKAR